MVRHLLAVGVGATLLVGCNGGQQSSVSLKALMAKQLDPAAKIYWNSVQYIADENGVRDIRPTNDAEWERTRRAAEDLGKFGRLLQTPVYAEDRNKDWVPLAQGLIDVGKQAERAAIDKDPDAVLEAGATLYNVCTACHMAFPAAAAGNVASPEKPQ